MAKNAANVPANLALPAVIQLIAMMMSALWLLTAATAAIHAAPTPARNKVIHPAKTVMSALRSALQPAPVILAAAIAVLKNARAILITTPASPDKPNQPARVVRLMSNAAELRPQKFQMLTSAPLPAIAPLPMARPKASNSATAPA